jgi:hypothetical protein
MSDPVIQSNLLVRFSRLLRDDDTVSNVHIMATQAVADSLLPIVIYDVNDPDTTVIIEIQDKNVNNI